MKLSIILIFSVFTLAFRSQFFALLQALLAFIILAFFSSKTLKKKDRFIIFSTGLAYFTFINVIFFLIILFSSAILGLNPTNFLKNTYSIMFILSLVTSIIKINYLVKYGISYSNYENEQKIKYESETSTDPIFFTRDDLSNFLAILSLDESVTRVTLKKRYNELVQIYHPDKFTNLTEKQIKISQTEFQKIKHAKEVIERAIEDGRL